MCKVIQFDPLPAIDYDIKIRHDCTAPQWHWMRITDFIMVYITCSSFDQIEGIRKAAVKDIENNYRTGSGHELSIP